MADQQSIIYVMRHIDVGGNIDIPYKKVGITGAGNATLSMRLQQISNTKSPIKAQCVAAWSHDDARVIENAIHLLLEDSRVEGEWFLDKNDTLVERLTPLMMLLGAKEMSLKDELDTYTDAVLRKESASQQSSNQVLLGEIASLLNIPLRSSLRKAGPTIFGDSSKLTFYVNNRKSGLHNVYIGRSKKVFNELQRFLDEQNYELETTSSYEETLVSGITKERVADIINLLESTFRA